MRRSRFRLRRVGSWDHDRREVRRRVERVEVWEVVRRERAERRVGFC